MKKRFSIILLTSAIIVSIMFEQLHAQEYYRPTLKFLSIINSPSAVGLGKCTINNVDKESALYNPACLGLLHLNSIFTISFPNSTEFDPRWDSRWKTFCASAGITSNALWPQKVKTFNYSLAIAYSRLIYDYGEATWHHPQTYDLIHNNLINKSDNYSISIAYEYFIRLGLGYTYKKISTGLYYPSDITIDANDLGIIVELPIAKILKPDRRLNSSKKRSLSWELTPSVAYTENNRYDESNEYADLPSWGRFGISINAVLNFKSSVLMSAKFVNEHVKHPEHYNDTSPRKGIEIGLADIAFIRFGRENKNTFGIGFKSRGVCSWLYTLNWIKSGNRLLNRILTNLDISIDYAVYNSYYAGENGESIPSKIQFFKIGMSF